MANQANEKRPQAFQGQKNILLPSLWLAAQRLSLPPTNPLTLLSRICFHQQDVWIPRSGNLGDSERDMCNDVESHSQKKAKFSRKQTSLHPEPCSWFFVPLSQFNPISRRRTALEDLKLIMEFLMANLECFPRKATFHHRATVYPS